MADRGDTRKASSAADKEAGEWGRNGARPENRGRSRGRRGNQARKTSGVWGNDGGCKASGVAHEYPGVGDKEGGREASRVAENPQRSRQVVDGGVESPQGTDTLIVEELPQGDETPRVTTTGKVVPREDGRG